MSNIEFHDATPITVWIDGGCRGNGTPNASGYCSVRIRGAKPQDTHYSIDLPGATTNNLAEYGALVCALDILKTLVDFPRQGGYLVHIHSDSALLVNQVAGDWKVKNANLRHLLADVRSRLEQLANNGVTVWLAKAPRDDIVAKLGH